MKPDTLSVEMTAMPAYEILTLNPDQMYEFPEGLPGFEKVKQYCLLSKEDEKPFLHLHAVGGFNLEFVVVSPWQITADYKPEISDDDLAYIGKPSDKELIILAIIVVAAPIGDSTANLAAPIIINAKNGKGKQIVIRNFSQYSNMYKFIDAQVAQNKTQA
jgi:flagellar assembly factor FliW